MLKFKFWSNLRNIIITSSPKRSNSKILFCFKEPANYEFSYEVKDAESGNDFGHQEARQGDVAEGKYYVLLPDGRLQTVEYTADTEGYKPKVTYEQVGGGGGYPSGRPNGGYQYWSDLDHNCYTYTHIQHDKIMNYLCVTTTNKSWSHEEKMFSIHPITV